MEQNRKTEKKPYEAPRITVLGDIEAITLGSATGQFTDAAFPIGTPFRSITFS
jgi:hypothetical protein